MRSKINNLTILSLLISVGMTSSLAGKGSSDFVYLKNNPVVSPLIYFIHGDPVKVWVKFTDKGIFSEQEFTQAVEKMEVSPRTIQRRAKVGATIELADLPLKSEYIEQIVSLIISTHQESRWLNAVSVTTIRSNLGEIAQLPFVAQIMPVAKGKPAGGFRWEESVNWKGVEGYNEKFEHFGHEGAFYGNSYDQLDQIGVIEAHRRGLYGDGVIIAILDGGFMLDHRCFEHAEVLAEWDFINQDPFTGYDSTQDIPSQPRHGTAVMSTIGAWDPGNLIGAAPYASFILAKTEDDRGETPVEEDNWVAGVEWAEWLGTDIITSSLSYLDWYSPAEFDGITAYASQAANRIYEMGVVICTSVGNEGPRPLTLGTPADAEGVLAIGAVDSTWSLVDFSSRGPTADGRIKPNVLAMGRHVTVARPYTYDEFSLGNGTSFSCPLAAGALALLIQAHPDWPSYEIYDAVENTATHAIYPDNAWGYGIVRLERALDYPSISGYIADAQNQKPVPSAYLFFASKDTSGTVTVDSAGFYLVGNLPYGQYRIIARAPGYLDGEAVTTSLPPDEVCDFKIRKR